MKQNQGGSIINVASIDAIHPSQIGLAAYDASKHGVWGFTKNFALEGEFTITALDGKKIKARPVFSLMKEHASYFTPEVVSDICHVDNTASASFTNIIFISPKF